MATANENMNPLKLQDRVLYNAKDHFLFNEKGVVIRVFDVSTEVRLDNGSIVITAFKNLKKLKS